MADPRTNAIATVTSKSELAAIESQGAQLIGMIGRLASDPNADIDKMERLMAMHERMLDREAELAFNGALSDMQPKIPVIGERGKIEFKGKVQSTYALWEDVNAAIKPILSTHGFSLSFKTETQPAIKVTATLRHKGGHKDTSEFIASADTSGSKNNIQGMKSTISYAKRITADALINITSHGEDDDAFTADDTDKVAGYRDQIKRAETLDDFEDISAKIVSDTDMTGNERTTIGKAWAIARKPLLREASNA